MDLSQFHYDLPESAIAQEPLADRAASRMLVLYRGEQRWEDRVFRDFPQFVRPGDCIVLNDSKVFPSRLYGRRVGFTGAVEVLLINAVSEDAKTWNALVHPGRKMRTRERVAFDGAEAEVIGEIADVHESNAEDNAGAQMYLPATKQFGPEGAYLVLRSKLPASSLARTVMITLRRMNPGQPATEFRSIQGLVDHATSPRRFFVLLVGIFAGLGLLLASLGVYGVISYSVTRQKPEIGIRMALGATQARVQLDVIWRTMGLALAGISVGVIASFAVSRLIASLLFRTAPGDPVTFVGMIVLLGVVALLAGYLPARRASKIDPMIALRSN